MAEPAIPEDTQPASGPLNELARLKQTADSLKSKIEEMERRLSALSDRE